MGNFLLPGQTVIPKSYGERIVLYTAGDRVECVVDGAPVGPNGRLFIINPNKPQQVPYEAGRFILEHLAYTGVVRVNEHETDTGIEYDIEGAKKESLALLEAMDRQRYDQFCRDCVTDYIANPNGAKPVPQPSPAIMAILQRRGWDLKSRGIVPIGWEEPKRDDPRVEDLQNQLVQLRAQLAAMTQPPQAPPAQPPADPKKGK
jgi:hypothetical protein